MATGRTVAEEHLVSVDEETCHDVMDANGVALTHVMPVSHFGDALPAMYGGTLASTSGLAFWGVRPYAFYLKDTTSVGSIQVRPTQKSPRRWATGWTTNASGRCRPSGAHG